MISSRFKILVILAVYCYQESLANHPANLRAVNITITSAILIWDTSTSSSVTGYAVYRSSPGPDVLIGKTTSRVTHYSVSSLNPGTNYCYHVYSYISGNLHTTASARHCFNTLQGLPSAPTLSSNNIVTTSRSATVRWSSCSGANRYYVGYRRSGSSLWTTIETYAHSTSITIPNLLPSTIYQFRVQCGDTVARSLFSSTQSKATVREVSPTLSSNNIITTSRTATVRWSGCSGANRYYVGYRRSGSSLWTTIETPGTSITIPNLLPSTIYQFRVQCGDAVAGSPFSSTQSKATVEDTIPPILNTIHLTQTEAHITWEASRQSISGTSYEIMAVGNHGTKHTCTSTSLSCTINNLTPETAYVFQTKAVSPQGTSAWTSPVSRNTLPIAPGSIVNFTAINRSISSMSVQWIKLNTATDLYKLTIDSGNASDADEVSLINSAERYTFHDLSPLTDYHITIWAVNKAGSGPVSTVNVTTLSVIDVPTDAPEGLIGSTLSLGILLILLILSVLVVLLALGCRRVRRKHISSTKLANSNDDVDMETNMVYSRMHQNSYLEEDSLSLCEAVETCRPPPRDRYMELAISTMPDIKPPVIGAPVYAYSEAFEIHSGWFKPSVNEVMSKKLGLSYETFARLGPGIFYLFHKTKMNAKYIGCACRLPVTLCGIVNNLYKKERSDLNPLEVELKHFSPSAEKWIIQVWQCNKKDLLLERAKRIIQFQTLKPYGLNQSLEITGKEVWEGFSQWYMESKKK